MRAQRASTAQRSGHVVGEETVVIPPIAFGVIHREVGIGLQRIRIAAIVRIDADADAARDVELVHLDEKRPRQLVEDLATDHRRILGSADAAEQNDRSEEHTSELQSLMRISYAVFCLKKK